MKIAVIKYGMGNVASVEKSLKVLGYRAIVSDNHEDIRRSDFIILPGVGSFQMGMDNLQKAGLADLLTEEVVIRNKPFLGICLGMQLLATYGTEPRIYKGLDWIKGEVVKIDNTSLRIPHLGWNNIKVEPSKDFYAEFDGLDYYFIHGFHFKPENDADVIMRVVYGEPLVAALQKQNIYAMQFHPEKSQEAGMRLLRKIIDQYA